MKRTPSADTQEHVFELNNGLQVVVVELDHLRAAHAAVFVRTGPRYESPRTHGLSHLVEHMLFRGCGPWRSCQELSREAERFQGMVEGVTYRDHAVYSTPLDPQGIGQALRLLATMMGVPRFQGLGTEKKILLEEINECFDERGQEIEIDNIASRLMFPDHPAGISIDGSLASVRRFRVKDLRDHHARFYTGSNMVVSVAGPVKAAEVERLARRAFASLPRGTRLHNGCPLSVPDQAPRFKLVRHPGSQTQLRLSFLAYPHGDPHVPALHMMRRVLDDGFTSRFQAELVDKRGLAYEMWADVDLLEDVGTMEFGALVTHGKESRTVRALLGEALRLSGDGPRADELVRARKRFGWALFQMHDHAAAVAEWFGRALLLGLTRRPQTILEQAMSVTPKQVRDTARELFQPARLALTVVGKPPRCELDAMRVVLQRFRGV